MNYLLNKVHKKCIMYQVHQMSYFFHGTMLIQSILCTKFLIYFDVLFIRVLNKNLFINSLQSKLTFNMHKRIFFQRCAKIINLYHFDRKVVAKL